VDTLSVVVDEAPVGLPVDDREAASRYIAAIVARDRRAAADARFAAWRAHQLWDRFWVEYEAVATGPYARHGGAALRIALDRL
jgi:hypothetical protein